MGKFEMISFTCECGHFNCATQFNVEEKESQCVVCNKKYTIRLLNTMCGFRIYVAPKH